MRENGSITRSAQSITHTKQKTIKPKRKKMEKKTIEFAMHFLLTVRNKRQKKGQSRKALWDGRFVQNECDDVFHGDRIVW